MTAAPLGWFGIVRLGLVQMALGAIVVLATSTLNRIMVVELALPALLPGLLVGLQYGVQVLRPRLGFGSDQGARRTPWIVGGMAVMATGGLLAALATAAMAMRPAFGIVLAVVAYALIGVGVGAAGTSLLVLLAKRVVPAKRPAAATVVWLMMIAGSAVTAGIAGQMLQPFSLRRMVAVVAVASLLGLALAVAAVWGVEGEASLSRVEQSRSDNFATALRGVWSDPHARKFSIFVFVSMLAYSAQELILEPFAGLVFGLTPGASTKLAGLQHGGVLAGMLLVALAGSAIGGRLGSMRLWTMGGCVASALALLGLAAAGFVGPAWPLRGSVFALGLANGTFAVSAIGAMMQLAGAGPRDAPDRAGTRMGLWGAAQAVAFGAGGLFSTGASDLARHLLGSPIQAYAAVFMGEALLFLIAARLAGGVFQPASVLPAGLPADLAIGGTR